MPGLSVYYASRCHGGGWWAIPQFRDAFGLLASNTISCPLRAGDTVAGTIPIVQECRWIPQRTRFRVTSSNKGSLWVEVCISNWQASVKPSTNSTMAGVPSLGNQVCLPGEPQSAKTFTTLHHKQTWCIYPPSGFSETGLAPRSCIPP